MDELEKNLMEHLDASKLLVQSEFGGGHRIASPAKSLAWIRREWENWSAEKVAECYARYDPVFLEIDRVLAAADGRRVTVAIDGMCGSGKSTLGRLLAEVYDCNLFHMDDFFLRPEQRTKARLAEVGGNVDYERFQEEVLACLPDLEGFSYQVFDCGAWKLGEIVRVPYKQLNIIEGAYSQHPFFGDVYDLRFYYGIDPEEQESRILKRNGPAMLERFRNEWIPMEMKYLEAYQIKENSIIV